jgi:hypothetical protein
MSSELELLYDADEPANRSQEIIDNFITNSAANNTSYVITEPLDGPIDLSIFQQQGRQPKHLEFAPGGITALLNIPRTLVVLKVNNNLLERVPDGTEHVRTLHCNNNKITGACDFSRHLYLEDLELDKNNISDVEDLPLHLKRLSIQENPDLVALDLSTAPECTHINCKQNPSLKHVSNVTQGGNTGFQIHADPHTKINYVDEAFSGGAKKKKEAEEEIHFEQSLDAYYALKAKYETQRHQKVQAIINMTASKKEKKNMMRKLPKKCVNCGKTGDGTRFWRKNDTLHAECAADGAKCGLKLAVPVGFFANIYYLLDITREDMQEKQEKIIRLKMDTLFNYITETASKTAFKKEMEMYQGDESMLNTYKAYETSMISDPVKQRLIAKKQADIHALLKSVRQMIEMYNRTGDKRLLEEAVEKQIKEIHPEVQALRILKHPVMQMNDQDDGTKKLVQNSYDYVVADYKLLSPS